MKKLVSMCLVLVLLLTLGSSGAFAAKKTAPKITVPAKLIGAYYLSGGKELSFDIKGAEIQESDKVRVFFTLESKTANKPLKFTSSQMCQTVHLSS